jgi:hypothetical protein
LTASDAAMVGPEERAHVRRAILGAALRSDPSPHVFVEQVFSAPFYQKMLDLFPGADAFTPWQHSGTPPEFFGNYARRGQLVLPDETERLQPDVQQFWNTLSAYLCAPEFARLLLKRFEDHYRRQFGSALDGSNFIERLRPGLVVNRHEPGYYLGPHTDRHEKVVTCVFYMPERDGLDHLGTAIYRPLEKEMRCRGFFHHDPARFERIATAPFRPNSMLIFARTDVFFHGVHRLTRSGLHGSERRGFQLQFYEDNTLPRHACRVLLAAEAPASVAAGSSFRVPYRLENRAEQTLMPSYPFRIHLGYRWFDPSGAEVATGEAPRTLLPGPVATGEAVHGWIDVDANCAPGRYQLRLSVVQDGVAWFDDIDPANGCCAEIVITPEQHRTRLDPAVRP